MALQKIPVKMMSRQAIGWEETATNHYLTTGFISRMYLKNSQIAVIKKKQIKMTEKSQSHTVTYFMILFLEHLKASK